MTTKLTEAYIRANDLRAISIDAESDGGLRISVHMLGGYASCTLDRAQALELLQAIKSMMGDNNA
jgi:hypothetical protein